MSTLSLMQLGQPVIIFLKKFIHKHHIRRTGIASKFPPEKRLHIDPELRLQIGGNTEKRHSSFSQFSITVLQFGRLAKGIYFNKTLVASF